MVQYIARLVNSLSFRGYLKWLPDELFLKIIFRLKIGFWPNLKNPKTFNEKNQWLKLHDRNPLYTRLVDKYEVRQYVKDTIGEEYLIPLLGVWDNFDDIDFDALPEQFVLKCTHDSGGLVICKDKSKFNIAAAKKKIIACMKRNYYWALREWPYKNVKPRIIAEKYMEDFGDGELRDYKFYTFNGAPHVLLLATNRQSKESPLCFDYFDMGFNHLPLTNYWHPNNKSNPPHEPRNFEEMKRLTKKLAEGIPFVRVDFYEVNGKTYFGEMTFFAMGGFLRIHPDSWDKEWGELIDLRKED